MSLHEGERVKWTALLSTFVIFLCGCRAPVRMESEQVAEGAAVGARELYTAFRIVLSACCCLVYEVFREYRHRIPGQW